MFAETAEIRVRAEGVAQRVRGDALGDAGGGRVVMAQLHADRCSKRLRRLRPLRESTWQVDWFAPWRTPASLSLHTGPLVAKARDWWRSRLKPAQKTAAAARGFRDHQSGRATRRGNGTGVAREAPCPVRLSSAGRQLAQVGAGCRNDQRMVETKCHTPACRQHQLLVGSAADGCQLPSVHNIDDGFGAASSLTWRSSPDPEESSAILTSLPQSRRSCPIEAPEEAPQQRAHFGRQD